MADEADDAAALTELFLQQSLANRNTGQRLAARGNCHYCETVFAYNPAELDAKASEFFSKNKPDATRWSQKRAEIEAALQAQDGAVDSATVDAQTQAFFWAEKRMELAAAVVDTDLDGLVDAALAGKDLSGRDIDVVRAEVREDLALKRIFCNADCAHDHEYEARLKARR